MEFDKCKLSLRSPTTPSRDMTVAEENNKENVDNNDNVTEETSKETSEINNKTNEATEINGADYASIERKNSMVAPDIVRGVENYSEDEMTNHKVKLEELQLRQKIMEEQNKKRKEMLAKALADR